MAPNKPKNKSKGSAKPVIVETSEKADKKV